MNGCIDAHQHLWDPSLFGYSWMKEIPSLNVAHRMEEYRDAARDSSIVGSVYVDTDVDDACLEGEASWIFALSDDPANRILGIVASVRLEQKDCFRHLEPFRHHPKLKGVRRVLHTQSDTLFRDVQFLNNLASIEARGWSFDLCVQARQLPLALELVKRFPGISFILDHCGSPLAKQSVQEPWRGHVRTLVEERNVVCKLSGLVGDDPNISERDLKPIVEWVIECFGWERILWGSDWPVCILSGSFRRWMEMARALVRTATPEEQEALFLHNARRVYRLELPEKTL